jgi:hypothetical protein
VRAALLDAFSFERRELGQDVLLSEVIATIQAVPGVAYVDVDALTSVRELDPAGGFERLQALGPPPDRIPVFPPRGTDAPPRPGAVAPAQIAVLAEKVPESLQLEEIR